MYRHVGRARRRGRDALAPEFNTTMALGRHGWISSRGAVQLEVQSLSSSRWNEKQQQYSMVKMEKRKAVRDSLIQGTVHRP
ncbi:hypothetical protein DAI22_07g268850 [Oryza sativa Japonica Group]|nr:hypothetical protein DAI22_07g268850 [Oryza sativa Japonica Group]